MAAAGLATRGGRPAQQPSARRGDCGGVQRRCQYACRDSARATYIVGGAIHHVFAMMVSGQYVRLTDATLRDAVRALTTRDASLSRLVVQYGEPPLWERPEGFVTLVRMILEQQVSLASAATLFTRLDGSINGGMQPKPILALGVHGLRALGVTRQKATYLVALAEHVSDGRLDLTTLSTLPDSEALTALQRVSGIGPWTAQVYLLFALGRPDAWPPGDLALHKTLQHVHELAHMPSRHDALQMAEAWSPWRAVAARILWHAYLTQRGRLVP